MGLTDERIVEYGVNVSIEDGTINKKSNGPLVVHYSRPQTGGERVCVDGSDRLLTQRVHLGDQNHVYTPNGSEQAKESK